MRILRECVGVIGIASLLIISFLFLSASKYDTADRIFLSIAIGIGALLIPVFFSFDGVRKSPTTSLLLAGWCLLIWLSYAFSQTKNFGFSEVLVLTFAALLGISISHLSEKRLGTLLRIIAVLTILSALYGFWYFPTHGEERMAGFLLDFEDPRHFFPNAFSLLILISWPLIFKFKSLAWRAISAAILFAALYLTFSRGAYLSLMVQIAGLGIWLFANRKKYTPPHVKKWLTAAIIIAAVFSTSLITLRNINFKTTAIGQKLTFQNNEQATSVDERSQFWRGSLRLAQERPLIGHGPMSFRYIYPPLQEKFLAVSDHPHNWLLKIAVENGIPAAVFFIIFMLGLFIIAVKNISDFSTFILAVSIAGGLAHNMIDYNMNFVSTIVPFFIICGALLAVQRQKPAGQAISKIAVGVWCVIALVTAALSGRELLIKFTHGAPSESFMTRDSLVHSPDAHELDLHLQKNPFDAAAWFLKGNYQKALALDPMNHFSYYRAVGPKKDDARLQKLLAEYDAMLAQNIHYTAFTDNPEEAARIYDLWENHTKAAEIRKKAAEVKQKFAAEHNFNKAFGPRTPINFFN